MEKKNVIFLSVIAVATLLTAVIGTTFAYFTASFTLNGQENATSKVTTKTLSTVSVTLGSPISGNPVYPGFKGVQEITLTGTTADVAGKVKLTVTPNIPTEFGTDVVWSLYKSDTAITCDKPVVVTKEDTSTGNQVYQTTNCTDVSSLSAIISDNTGSNSEKSTELEVPIGSSAKYYLVAEYKNNAATAQNSAMGKTFSLTVNATQVDTTTAK